MFKVCRLISNSEETVISLKKFFGGYPIEISKDFTDNDLPTILVGWDFVKELFPNQKIHDKNISKNLEWTYSESECKEIKEENFIKNLEEFLNDKLKKWLPKDFVVFDSLIRGDIESFIEKNIDNSIISYIHFNDGAIYIKNGDRNFILNIKTLWLINDNYRDVISKIINNIDCMLYTYDELENYANLDLLEDIKALDIIRWVKYGIETPIKYFQIIPGINIHKYVPFLMSKIHPNSLELNSDELTYFKRMCKRDIATRWMSNRYVSFSYDFDKKLDFIYREHSKLSKIKYSTKRTITGRITSVDKYNPQNLSKSNNDRAFIKSRFRGGKIYQFDYTSFEARIALYLSQDDFFIEQYYDKDLHLETARIIFDKFDVNTKEREVAKLANMAIMYGASEPTVLKMLEEFENPLDLLVKIRAFLAPIFKKAKEINEECKSKGYVINKWGSIIKPDKDFAAFNNYLQSTASEILVDKIFEIKKLLLNKKTQFMFQVHDSLVFDIHPDERFLIEDITKSMSYNKGMIFKIDHKSGLNYKDLYLEDFYF